MYIIYVPQKMTIHPNKCTTVLLLASERTSLTAIECKQSYASLLSFEYNGFERLCTILALSTNALCYFFHHRKIQLFNRGGEKLTPISDVQLIS